MGIKFIAEKSPNFEHRRDKKFAEEIQSGNLLSGIQEKTTHLFRCKSVGDTKPQIGMGVLLYLEGDTINVIHLNKKIGWVMSPDAAEIKKLWAMMQAQISSGSVVSVRPAAKVFMIQLI
jgi:hypothetical protein